MRKGTKVVTGLVRFAYAKVHTPEGAYDWEKRYSVSILIPKEDDGTCDDIVLAVNEAMERGKDKLQGVSLENLKMPMRDGDVERPEEEAFAGCFFINAYSMSKPCIVDKEVKEIEAVEEFYSGCYGRASIYFYAFNKGGSVGIACGLGNLQKLNEGPVLRGSSDPKVEFGEFPS